MHCELLVPGLLSIAGGPRMPALELLLARGRAARSDAASPEAWLAGAFGLAPDALPAGALTVLAEDGSAQAGAGAGSWVRADPVHLRLLRDRIVVVPPQAFALPREEADALCATLNRHFSGRLELQVRSETAWTARVLEPLEVSARSPLEMAGMAAAPGRGDRLLTEIQMALHEHPVNQAREARGDPAVNSLWLWGAGEARRAGEARWHSVSADDPVARGLAQDAGLRARRLSAAGPWLERAPGEGRHLVVLDALRPFATLGDEAGHAGALEALERDWFAPLLAALRAGRIGMVTLHVPDAREALSVETIRGDLRRFWRRPRARQDWVR
jgi:hypothetical protein